MDHAAVMAVMNDPIAQELVTSAIPARLAYTALDGSPRVVPIGFVWDGAEILMFTIPFSTKVAALRADARVALTVDTNIAPQHVLLLRGRADVSIGPGVPEQFLAASHRLVPAEGHADFDNGVRALYVQTARIAVALEWAKILDFETRAPDAVVRLAAGG